MYAAAAAGKEDGGYENISEAARHLAKLRDEVYLPNEENAAVYDRLFALYQNLVKVFDPAENPVLEELKSVRVHPAQTER